eukprot:jgi/Mesen1/3823/ME000207S02832
MSKLLVAALVLAIAVTGASAAATDVYTPVCDDFPFSNTPASAWKKWSSPSTWPDGQVPGVNPNKGVTAVISCDQRVILDVTNITLDILVINGWLKVQDKGPIQVLANYVLNQGLFSIGTPQAPYEGKIIFNMTGANYQLNITRPPATVQDPRSLGYRAFATVGGQLQFNGMYGNQLGWTKLAKTAPVGAMQITVKGDVSKWPVGGKIAIASTDFDRKQAENFTITAVAAGAGGTTVLSLDSPLYYMHWGDPIDTGVGVMMDEAAEVALLTRSIVIQGHPNPQDALIGEWGLSVCLSACFCHCLRLLRVSPFHSQWSPDCFVWSLCAHCFSSAYSSTFLPVTFAFVHHTCALSGGRARCT